MASRKKTLLALTQSFVCLAFGAAPKHPSSQQQSTRTINVFVYTFHGLPSWVLDGAKTETARILQQAAIEVKWRECNSEEGSACQTAAGTPGDLALRFVPHALPPASKTALAMAFPSAKSAGSAFIFYDRVVAMQTSTSLLQTMLGRVVAHEIVHLLLPGQEHSHSGLMRGLWNQDDFRFTSTTSETLSPGVVALLHERARHRISAAQSADHIASVPSAPGMSGN